MTDPLDISRNPWLPTMAKLGEIFEKAARSNGDPNKIDETEKAEVQELWGKYVSGCKSRGVTRNPEDIQCNVDSRLVETTLFTMMGNIYQRLLWDMSAQEMTRAMLLLREHPPLDERSYPQLRDDQRQQCSADDEQCLLFGGHRPQLACAEWEDPITEERCVQSAISYCAPWKYGPDMDSKKGCATHPLSE